MSAALQPGLLASVARTPAERPALFTAGDGVICYGELRALVAQAAVELPVPAGGLVALYGERDLATVVAYLACLTSGRAVALYDRATPVGTRLRQLAAFQPDAVLYAPPYSDSATGTRDGGDRDAGDRDGDYRSVGVLAGGARILARVNRLSAPDAGATALLLATSGSSGAPRSVRLTLSNVDSNADAIARALRLTADDRALTGLPLHYCYGLSVLNAHLAAGAGVILTRAGAPSRPLWRAALDWSATSLAGLPSTFEALRRSTLRLDQLPALRLVTQAGGRLPAELVSQFHRELDRRGGRFVVMYGQTEATARITVLDHEEIPGHPGSVGRPIDGVRVHVEDEHGQPVPDGQVGNVVVGGTGVMLGYATCRADLARGDETHGRLPTGDLGRIENGYLTLAGRVSRFTKVAGRRVDLDEVEAACAAVAPAAVVATSDERVHICVPGDRQPFLAVRQRLASQLRIPVARLHLVQVNGLPRTSSGKLDYPALATLAEANLAEASLAGASLAGAEQAGADDGGR